MAEKIPAILSWSGGKDCAYALYKVLQDAKYEVKYLLSIFKEDTHTLNMHRVPETIMEQQAAVIGIPMIKVFVGDSSNSTYEKQLAITMEAVREAGIYHIIFGDLFLQDLRHYREISMQTLGMSCVFPLWQMPSLFLINDFIAKGFKALTCCTDAALLTREFIGRQVDELFIKELPANVDPCGENGEYHSFCYDAPYFTNPVNLQTGRIYFEPLELKTQDKAGTHALVQAYWFCELTAKTQIAASIEKICPRCLQKFDCRQADIRQCDCYGVSLSPGAKKALSAFNDCLCRHCLEQLAGHKAP